VHRVESTRYDWSFQPWPGRGHTLPTWDDEAARARTVVLPKWSRRRSLLALVPLLVVALTAAAVDRWFVHDGAARASPRIGLSGAAAPDPRIAAFSPRRWQRLPSDGDRERQDHSRERRQTEAPRQIWNGEADWLAGVWRSPGRQTFYLSH